MLSVAVAIAGALKISVGELAGLPDHRADPSGEWRTSWRTSKDGMERITLQEVGLSERGDLINVQAKTRGPTRRGGRLSLARRVAVVITAADSEWLAGFTQGLVEDRLCVRGHNISAIRLIYRWKGAVHDEAGTRVARHTRRALVARTEREQPRHSPFLLTNGKTWLMLAPVSTEIFIVTVPMS